MLKNVYLLILSSFLLVACSAEYTAVYQKVSAESKWDDSGKITTNNSKNNLPLFKIVDNQLYLMIQLTEVEWFFRTIVSYPSWDKAEVSRLLQEHRDIESLIPDDWNNWLPAGFGEECIPK